MKHQPEVETKPKPLKELKNRHADFGVVEVILSLVIVCAIVALGWYVHRSLQSINTTYNSATKISDSASPKFVGKKVKKPATGYLDITQWGVELPLSSPISDAYYVVPTGISPDEDGEPSSVILGLTSLNSSCGTVTADATGYANNLGVIVRTPPTSTDPVSGELYTKLDPDGTTIGAYYYAYTGGMTGKTCASASTLQAVESAFSDAVKAATTTGSTAPATTSSQYATSIQILSISATFQISFQLNGTASTNSYYLNWTTSASSLTGHISFTAAQSAPNAVLTTYLTHYPLTLASTYQVSICEDGGQSICSSSYSISLAANQ